MLLVPWITAVTASNNSNRAQSPFNAVAQNIIEEKKKKIKRRKTLPISLSADPKHSFNSDHSFKKAFVLLKANGIK